MARKHRKLRRIVQPAVEGNDEAGIGFTASDLAASVFAVTVCLTGNERSQQSLVKETAIARGIEIVAVFRQGKWVWAKETRGGKVWPNNEKQLLQGFMAIGCIVPITAGIISLWRGAAIWDEIGPDLNSQFRYLSGLLLGTGLAFAATIPEIEKKTATVRLLTFIVVTGGIGRAVGLLHDTPSAVMIAALFMELAVTPVLCLWQARIARRFISVGP